MTHFYCTRCNKWFSFGSSIGNIKTHLRCRHDDLWQPIRPDEIVHMIYAFIITNGLSFRIVEDKYLSRLLPIPISRQQVARVCDTAAKLIDQKITTQALSYREVVGAFD